MSTAVAAAVWISSVRDDENCGPSGRICTAISLAAAADESSESARITLHGSPTQLTARSSQLHRIGAAHDSDQPNHGSAPPGSRQPASFSVGGRRDASRVRIAHCCCCCCRTRRFMDADALGSGERCAMADHRAAGEQYVNWIWHASGGCFSAAGRTAPENSRRVSGERIGRENLVAGHWQTDRTLSGRLLMLRVCSATQSATVNR